MRQKTSSVAQVLLPSSICALCHQYHRENRAVCHDCLVFFEPLGPACCSCAEPLPDESFLACGRCCRTKPPIDKTIVAYRFEEPLRTLLHEFKYQEGLYLCALLAGLIQEALPLDAQNTQCLIPIPMHRKRLRQRGFNQAAELAKHLGHILHVPVDSLSCQKIMATPPQAGLSGKERRKNVRNTFRTNPIPYQHVTLIDDLITTGSTAFELASMLKKQGILRVDLWCTAKATSG